MIKKIILLLFIIIVIAFFINKKPEHIDYGIENASYFGNEASGDLNGDGKDDKVFLIVQKSEGSGTFYYAIASIQTDKGYKNTNPFFIGDRIAPQSTSIVSREIYINYAERKQGEPMTTPPSQGATLLLKVTPEGVLEGLMR